jgi:uncharacterized membrane protein
VDELGSFLGHFHPVWVHLPIGILVLLGILEVAGLASRSPRLSWLPAITARQRTLILSIAAAAAILAAVLGWLLARGGDYDPALVARHQSLGISTACATVLLLAVHRLRPLYAPALALSLVLLTATADAGAKITHGTNYLTAHLPPPIGRLMGIAAPGAAQKPRAVGLDRAVAFTDVVQPILRERCVGCHGPAKSNGGLRLDTWELLAKGGKHGPAVKPGDLALSPLVLRIGLPDDAKEHMPPKGKPQLVDDDVTLLEWWVGAGAPRDKAVAAMDMPPSVEEILGGRLGGDAAETPPDRAATLAAAAQIAAKLGIMIRPLTPDGPWVDVNARPAGRAFGDGELAQLAPIAPAVQWLDLGATAVTDAGLSALAPMRRLERLHLDQTRVTDDGLARLSRLKRIEYLNLRGTAVTDKGLAALRSLPHLRSLYLWQSAVTPAAAQALGESLVDRRRIARWKSEEAELERRIQAEHFDANTGESLRPAPKPPTDVAAHKAAPPDRPAPPK